MKRSSISKVAKAVHKKLIKSETKDVLLYTKGDWYKVKEYGEDVDDSYTRWDVFTMGFNYSDRELPTIEEIEQHLIDTFITIHR